MKTTDVPESYQHISPAGAEVRLLLHNPHGGIAHCTLKEGKVSQAVRHKTASEFWHVLSGQGKIWRRNKDKESVTDLTGGVTIDIPLGADFQYRSDEGDLVFICVTTPPWSGADEAQYVDAGTWLPTVK